MVRIMLLAFLFSSCGSPDTAASRDATTAPPLADVVGVRVEGTTFSVTVQSPDEGCDQYANWWEVLRPDGTLVHRRILGHSHVAEQPFTRSSGPVEVDAGEELIVRAHMHPGGYGGAAMRGTVSGGFAATDLPATFANGLATADPLPASCAF